MENETLIQDLKACHIDGNILHLPKEPLNDYPALKRAMEKAGGKYKRSTFIFERDNLNEVVDKLLNGEKPNIKKETQYFPTPRSVFDEMIQFLDADLIKEGCKILEPSAGQGNLIQYITQSTIFPIDCKITAVENDDYNFTILKDTFYSLQHPEISYFKLDFLQLPPSGDYDLIIANPPFKNQLDIKHVDHMMKFLKPGGQLISIMSAGILFRSNSAVNNFMEMLDDSTYKYSINKMDENSFQESGTNVSTALLYCKKK